MANTQGSILHTKQGVHEHSACRHNTNTQVTQGIHEVIVPSRRVGVNTNKEQATHTPKSSKCNNTSYDNTRQIMIS